MQSDTYTFTGGFVDVNEAETGSFCTIYNTVFCTTLNRGAYIEMLRVDGYDYKWILISKTDFIGIG